jgi:hypothetical protein
MALLDLQGMELTAEAKNVLAGGSSKSKHSHCGASLLSTILVCL